MLSGKPSLYINFVNTGDIRVLIDLIEKYDYTNDEASEVINIYTPDKCGKIPEVEHIEVLLSYFPNSKILDHTIIAIKKSFPNSFDYIKKLSNQKIE